MMAPTAVPLSATMVCEATRGTLVAGSPTRLFDGVSTDSRHVRRDALFIALKGDRFDGHDFVTTAVNNGAGGALVSGHVELGGPVTVVQVADTLAALQALARAIRRASGARVVAITGSAGKTTTKEVMADLLALKYRVHRNAGNLNNHIGLPLSLVELRLGPDVAVVELGMNHAGEIRTLVGIAEPDIRVWTNVGDAHIGAFLTREAVARAKAEILEGATGSTLVVANADDPLVMAHVSTWSGRTITFGESAAADVRATSVIDRGFDGTSALVSTPAGLIDLSIPLPGRVHLSNVLAAVAVAVECGVGLDAIREKVATLQPVARRGRSTIGAGGVRVVDDSYNASPAAVMATLEALAKTPATGRRIAVIGEMLELGAQARSLHHACGRAAARASVDVLVAVGGPDADALAEGAIAEGLDPVRVLRFASSATAADAIGSLVHPFDVVLIKGSRGTRTDLVVDRLLEVA